MPIVVVGILLLGGHLYQGEDDEVGYKVGERMQAVGHHGSTLAQHACNNLACCEQEIHCRPD